MTGSTPTISPRDLALVEKMNLLTEVNWDRWTGWYEYPGGEGISVASPFGWIERDDGRFDFVTLTTFWTDANELYHVAFQTSSAHFSREFAERLGIGSDDHQDCRRIENDLDLVERKVVLA